MVFQRYKMRKFLKVGMSVEDYQDLQNKAYNLNMTISSFTREMLKNGKIIEKQDNNKILYHLNKIGNNINQVARFANKNKYLDIQIYNLLVEIKSYIDNLTNDNISK